MKRQLLALLLALASVAAMADESERWKASSDNIAFPKARAILQDWSQSRAAARKPAAKPGADAAGDLLAAFNEFLRYRNVGKGRRAPELRIQDQAAVAARIELAANMDKYLATDLIFRTRSGKAFHVAANTSLNCADGSADCDAMQKYFFLFTSDQVELFSANVYQIANYSIFKFGHKDIAFDGDAGRYTVRMRVAGLSSPRVRDSVLEISDSGSVVFTATLGQVLDAVSKRSVPAALDRAYGVILGRDLYQDENQEAFFGKAATMVFMPANSDFKYVRTLAVPNITADGVMFPSIWNNFAFRKVQDQAIEIYRVKS